jgi:hypothetical protein
LSVSLVDKRRSDAVINADEASGSRQVADGQLQ